MNTQLRRLPIAVGPAQQETVTSYVRRLAELHAMPYLHLWRHLSAPSPRGATSHRRRLVVANRLAAVTGHHLTALAHAMPELRDPAPDWQQLRHLPQRACPGCSARHPGGHVVRFFAHHEFVCTRHGYWIGPPLPTMPDLRPRQVARQIPELVTAQRRHNRLLRRRGWRRVLNAIDVSTSVCIDQRFCEPIDAPLRRCWQQRIDLLIPSPGWFNTSVFLAAFYPEIVNLARLFCSPTWRRVADEALTSTTHRQAITAEIIGAIGREPHPPALPSYEVDRWLRAMVDDPIHVRLTYTFPQTRRVTPDGVPIKCSGTEENRARKAAKEFGKHRHVPTWALPHYVSRPTDHDTPIGYQPSDHDERPDLSQFLTTLATEGAN